MCPAEKFSSVRIGYTLCHSHWNLAKNTTEVLAAKKMTTTEFDTLKIEDSLEQMKM